MTLARIVRRLLLYLGLALASLAIFSLVFFLSIRTHIVVPFQWVGLAAFAAVLVFAIIKTDRTYWTRPAFWLILVGVLIVHLAFFIPVLRSYPDFRLVWWVPIVIVEAGIFGVICDMLLLRPARSSRRAKSREKVLIVMWGKEPGQVRHCPSCSFNSWVDSDCDGPSVMPKEFCGDRLWLGLLSLDVP